MQGPRRIRLGGTTRTGSGCPWLARTGQDTRSGGSSHWLRHLSRRGHTRRPRIAEIPATWSAASAKPNAMADSARLKDSRSAWPPPTTSSPDRSAIPDHRPRSTRECPPSFSPRASPRTGRHRSFMMISSSENIRPPQLGVLAASGPPDLVGVLAGDIGRGGRPARAVIGRADRRVGAGFKSAHLPEDVA